MSEFRWSDLELTKHEPVDGVCRRCSGIWPCPWMRAFNIACGSLLGPQWRDTLAAYVKQFDPMSRRDGSAVQAYA